MNKAPPSLVQIRTGLKQVLASERDANRRKEIGRALAAIERAERQPLDTGTRKA